MGRTLPLAILLLFTVPAFGQSPGGINTNLQLWLKAEGYTGGGTWTDNSGNTRNAVKTGTVPNTALYNFQNVPTGLSASNYFSIAHNTSLNTNSGAMSVFAVGLPGTTAYGPFVCKTSDQYWDNGWVLATSSPATTIGFTTGDWVGTGGSQVALQAGASTTIPYIASGFGSGAGTNVVSVCRNGNTVATSTSTKTSTTRPLYIGFDGDVYDFSGGSIAEVIMYNGDLSAPNRDRVWTYLALKYGITLNNGGTSYVNSASTTVWNTTTNSGYNNNIFGIGLDNGSGLSQRQSVSINSGLQPVIANGTTLVNLNSSGTALSVNQSFLIAGSDNADVTFTTAISGLTGLTGRLDRIWKVQKTGTVGNVTVAWPDNDASIKLVVSGDAIFNGSDVAYATTAITINGTAYRQATVSLSSGQYFTFATNVIAPGGIVNKLSLWLASDAAGVAPGSNAPAWNDISRIKNPVETIGTRTLQQPDAAHNFQPYFNNFSTTNHFKDVNSSLAPENSFLATEVTMFGVARINSTTSDGRIVGMDDVDLLANDPGLSVFHASARFHRTTTSATALSSTTLATQNRSSMFSTYTAGTTVGAGVDGTYNTAAITSGGGITGDVLVVGNGTGTISGALPGDLQEVIWYRQTLNATEIKQVETYLAIKHGITLGGNAGTGAAYNYLNTAGTTVWDKSANTSYNNDIAGIGRDDASALLQKQSMSVNSTGSVTIGLVSIAASNAANANTFTADRSFLIWGHNGGANNSVFNDATLFTNLPTGVQARVQRKWKFQTTNFAQTTTVGFPQTGLVAYSPVSNLRLLVDDDGVNWSNATVYTGAVSTGGRVEFSGVAFTSAGPYFTLATVNFASTPLPIELISFEGRTVGYANELSWSTASERNNDHFDVERSTDGMHFQRIGTVAGEGNSQQLLHYTLLDEAPINGLNYYRLLQTDEDGTNTYSSIVVLRNERAATTDCIVRTLDAEGLFTFSCTVPEGSLFELFTQTGQPLKAQRFRENGSQEVDLRSFAAGIYFARITDGVSVKSYKLLRP
jgi:hypothetical protein